MTSLQHAPFAQQQATRVDVDEYLKQFYLARIARAETVSADYARLWRVLLTTYKAGGKRLRPYVFLLAYRAAKGASDQDVLPVAAALEILHASMLIHDDIIDRDTIRHGKPNVAGTYHGVYGEVERHKQEHLATSAALLGGDVLLAAAHTLVAESSLPSDKKIVALGLLSDAVFNVVGGELLDAESITKPMAEVDSLAIARYKTAHYSFVTPLVMGATLADADQRVRAAFSDYGTALGVAFQLADDLLGLFGDEEETGKPAISDLREGRRTHLLQQAYRMASAKHIATLETIVGSETVTPQQLETARMIVRDCGAYDAIVQEIQAYARQAEVAIGTLNLEPDVHAECMALIDRATVRRA